MNSLVTFPFVVLIAISPPVIIPKDNEKDLSEIPSNVKRLLNIIPLSRIEEVLNPLRRAQGAGNLQPLPIVARLHDIVPLV